MWVSLRMASGFSRLKIYSPFFLAHDYTALQYSPHYVPAG